MHAGCNRDAQLPDQRVRGRRREISPDCHGPVTSTCQERPGYRLRQQGETNKHLLSFPLLLLSAQNSDMLYLFPVLTFGFADSNAFCKAKLEKSVL